MSKKQVLYLYMYGSSNQVATIRELIKVFEEEIDGNLQKELMDLVRYIADYQEQRYYEAYFNELCREINKCKDENEVSLIEAIEMREDYYGKIE